MFWEKHRKRNPPREEVWGSNLPGRDCSESGVGSVLRYRTSNKTGESLNISEILDRNDGRKGIHRKHRCK